MSRPDARRLDVRVLSVTLGGRKVGTLAQTPEGTTAFEYDRGWLADGFSISPLSLPLAPGVFVAKAEPFDGLFGVFRDSLPDGWGELLLSRLARSHGIDPASLSPMARLAIVGSSGRGALSYEPEVVLETPDAPTSLDEMAAACAQVLNDQPCDNLDRLFASGGSSGGARPKAYLRIDGQEWLVKFPSHLDPPDAGRLEYEYSLAARACGIEMAPTRLFESHLCPGYFGTVRFDRGAGGSRTHMVSASGLLEVTHRLPLLDYRHLFQLTARLAPGDASQLMSLFQVMCFNAFSHNQDDHSNNFSWICEAGRWRLAPAYDLTYSTSYGNEHSTSVDGNGQPTMANLLTLAEEFGLPTAKARSVAERTSGICRELLERLGLEG